MFFTYSSCLKIIYLLYWILVYVQRTLKKKTARTFEILWEEQNIASNQQSLFNIYIDLYGRKKHFHIVVFLCSIFY
jgi:hypothetical protein